MGRDTEIQWCDSTINPTTGCDGCEIWSKNDRSCYAGNYHEGRMASVLPVLYAKDFNEVRMAPGRVMDAANWSDLTGVDRLGTKHVSEKPWLNKYPRIVFISDMSDALSKAVTFDYLKSEIIDNVTSRNGHRHIWMWLSKQPQRMVQFAGFLRAMGITWPRNLWAGTSITNARQDSRIENLLRVPAAFRFLSVEPMRNAVGLAFHAPWCASCGDYPPDGTGSPRCNSDHKITTLKDHINLVICGGESGKDPRICELSWIENLQADCAKYRVPFFMKQMGRKLRMSFKEWNEHWMPLTDKKGFVLDEPHSDYGVWTGQDLHGGDWNEWPERLRVRQMPSYVRF